MRLGRDYDNSAVLLRGVLFLEGELIDLLGVLASLLLKEGLERLILAHPAPVHGDDDAGLERNRELASLGGAKHAVSAHRHEEHIDLVDGLSCLMREHRIRECAEMHERHALE